MFIALLSLYCIPGGRLLGVHDAYGEGVHDAYGEVVHDAYGEVVDDASGDTSRC